MSKKDIEIELYPIQKNCLKIVPGKPFRKWISDHGHAARCIPLMAVNQFGWDIILDTDIKVKWNGGAYKEDCVITSPPCENEVKRESHFGMGIITLSPGFTMKTPEGMQLMIRSVPNQWSTEWVLLEAAIETDMLKYPWFLSIKVLVTKEITIKAGTRIARIMPVDLGSMSRTSISIKQEPEDYVMWRDEFGALRNKVDVETRVDPRYPNVTRVYKKNNRFQRVRSPNVINEIEKQGKSSIELWIEKEILIIDNHLTEHECKNAIQWWEDNENIDSDVGFWSEKVVNTSETLGTSLDKDMISKAESFFGVKLRAFDHNIVRWKPGDSMGAHTDIGGKDGEFDKRHFAAITYLNSNYEGGNTVFLDQDIEIVPDAGSTLIFRGGDIKHSVNEIKGNNRYTLVRWLEIID